MTYEELVEIAHNEGISVVEYDFKGESSGFYCDGVAFINKHASSVEKTCLLAEEIGHHFTATEDISLLDNLNKIKQEASGRRWGYEELLSFDDIIDSIIGGCENRAEIADHLGVSEDFLSESLTYYSRKYGAKVDYGDYVVSLSAESIIVHPTLD